jgi:predicted CopG family antitoxin
MSKKRDHMVKIDGQEAKSITIAKDVWKIIAKLKFDKEFNNYSEVIRYLAKEAKVI